ncbi:MAG TPA: phosphatase PAP2 family protein [Acidimicrobiales bacterium]|nr:phosphatase PAP2 family protein [Acidimicrobiales bacterium]
MARITDAVDRFDHRVDQQIERLRGNAFTDRLFYVASFLGDHGLIWIALSLMRYFTNVGGPDAAHFAGIRALCAELGQSILVNLGIKSLFRRQRPVPQAPRPFHLRVPRTTSFPSGHATASFTAAVLLSQGTPWGPALFVLASIVAFSRAYVKIHHASDVVGGVVIGLALGLAVIGFFPLP